MPNWCNNTITIEHKDSVKLKEVINSLTTKRIDDSNESLFFTYCKPEPTYENKDDWYDWRWNNWGTKWNIDILEEGYDLNVHKDHVWFSCDTAWSPPLNALVELEKKGFTINCEYYECGCAFMGKYCTKDGHQHYDLPETYAEIKKKMDTDEVFKDLAESWGVDLDYKEMESEGETE